MVSEMAIDVMHRHCNYKGVVYPVIDWTRADWKIDANILEFIAPDEDHVYGRNGSVNIEEIYIGTDYTLIIATTTERVEMWFSNALENICHKKVDAVPAAW